MYKLMLLSLVLASTAFACPGLRHGDLNCDEKIDINDFTILAENWLRKYAMSYPDKLRITGGEDLGFAFSEDPMDVAWPQGDFVLTKTADKWLGQLELQGSGGMLIVMEIVLVDGNCLLRSTDNPDDIIWGKMGDESITGFYEPITPKTFGIATITAYNETNGDTIMAKIYLTAAQSNQLADEAEIKIRAFKRAETRQVFDFQDTEDWGVYDDSTGISGANSLSDAHAVNGYKEFEVEIPTLVHETDTVLQICDTAGSALFAVYKDAKSLHCYNPGMSLVDRKTQIR